MKKIVIIFLVMSFQIQAMNSSIANVVAQKLIGVLQKTGVVYNVQGPDRRLFNVVRSFRVGSPLEPVQKELDAGGSFEVLLENGCLDEGPFAHLVFTSIQEKDLAVLSALAGLNLFGDRCLMDARVGSTSPLGLCCAMNFTGGALKLIKSGAADVSFSDRMIEGRAEYINRSLLFGRGYAPLHIVCVQAGKCEEKLRAGVGEQSELLEKMHEYYVIANALLGQGAGVNQEVAVLQDPTRNRMDLTKAQLSKMPNFDDSKYYPGVFCYTPFDLYRQACGYESNETKDVSVLSKSEGKKEEEENFADLLLGAGGTTSGRDAYVGRVTAEVLSLGYNMTRHLRK